MSSRLALHGCVERKQDLFDLWVPRTLDETADVQPLGADSVEWRKVAAEHVIERIDHAGALKGPEVRYILDHHDERAVAPGILADGAWGHCVDGAANRALNQLCCGIVEGCRQRHEQVIASLQQGKGCLAGRPITQPR